RPHGAKGRARRRGGSAPGRQQGRSRPHQPAGRSQDRALGMGPYRLAWRQLARERVRLLIVSGGGTFAVVRMLMQRGVQNSLDPSAVTLHRGFVADLFMISPLMPAMQKPNPFSARRLYQAASVPGVQSVAPVYFSLGSWRNPQTGKTRGILL